KDGRTSVNSEPHSGRPSTCRNENVIEQVRTLAMEDRRITVRELSNETGVRTGSVHSILTEDLGMRRVSAKFEPKLLTMEQKQSRLEITKDMLDNANSNPNFLNTVITGDESWVYGYDPETKMQSSLWKHPTSPRPKKAWQVRSNVKVMLAVFFKSCGVVHHEYAPQGQTITKEYYQEVLRHLRDAARRNRPDLWAAKSWQCHHDNRFSRSLRLQISYIFSSTLKMEVIRSSKTSVNTTYTRCQIPEDCFLQSSNRCSWRVPQSPRARKVQQVQSSTKSMLSFLRHEVDCSP
ncbi:hypothetical protein B7P43_G06496, partial [Cryptotermes secundus]